MNQLYKATKLLCRIFLGSARRMVGGEIISVVVAMVRWIHEGANLV